MSKNKWNNKSQQVKTNEQQVDDLLKNMFIYPDSLKYAKKTTNYKRWNLASVQSKTKIK